MMGVLGLSTYRNLVRYFFANLLGVTIDVALALVLVSAIGMATTLAATISIIIAASVMYIIHERWTFAGDNRSFSLPRLVAVVVSAFVGMAARATAIYLLQMLPFDHLYAQYAHIIIAVGVSFIVNFLLVKTIMERRPFPKGKNV